MLNTHFFWRPKAIVQKSGIDPSNAGQPVAGRLFCRVVCTATLLYLASIVATHAADSLPEQQTSEFIEGKAKACLFCHNADRMHAILDTPHGSTENPDSPYAQHECESCHGPGRQHSSRLRQNETRVPMINYGPKSATPFAKQSQTCLDNCHEKDMEKLKGLEWVGSVHGRVWVGAEGNKTEVSCANCHKLHGKHAELQDRTHQAKVCYECHERSEREHPRFEDKGIVFEKLTCWDCHDVHQLIVTPIPDAESPAARVYAARCGVCHVARQPDRLSYAGWVRLLPSMERHMAERGMAPLSEADRNEILGYLKAHAR